MLVAGVAAWQQVAHDRPRPTSPQPSSGFEKAARGFGLRVLVKRDLVCGRLEPTRTRSFGVIEGTRCGRA